MKEMNQTKLRALGNKKKNNFKTWILKWLNETKRNKMIKGKELNTQKKNCENDRK